MITNYYPYPEVLRPAQREVGTDGRVTITLFDYHSSGAIGQETLIPDSESGTPVWIGAGG